jgi:hypothetical protein
MRTRILVAMTVAAFAAAVWVAGATAGGKATPRDAGAAQGTSKLEKRALFAVLTGRNEVDADGRRGAGDPNGRGSFTAIVDGDQLCFGITVTNLDPPSGAHIHKARPNRNGPIVVPLTPPTSGDPGASSGCVEVDAAIAKAILRHPRQYYANVHTGPFPGGAVRGQLFRRSK